MRVTFRELLNKKEKVLGVGLQKNAPELLEIYKYCGFDIVRIDLQHSENYYKEALDLLRAAEAVDLAAYVRVPSVNERDILKLLDMGYSGISAPCVNTVETARDFVNYSKYPPVGKRSACPHTRAHKYDFDEDPTIYEKDNENTVLRLAIEEAKSFEEIEQIIDVPGYDFFGMGLHDLAISLGIPGQIHDPRVVNMRKQAFEMAKRRGKFLTASLNAPGDIDKVADDPAIRLVELHAVYPMWLMKPLKEVREAFENRFGKRN